MLSMWCFTSVASDPGSDFTCKERSSISSSVTDLHAVACGFVSNLGVGLLLASRKDHPKGGFPPHFCKETHVAF